MREKIVYSCNIKNIIERLKIKAMMHEIPLPCIEALFMFSYREFGTLISLAG